MTNITKIYTHGGTFHADEAFASAMIRVLNPNCKILRVFKVPEEVTESDIVVDIGFGHYDHHQSDGVPCRPDGGKRAACGLVWEDVKDLIFQTESTKTQFEQNFIIPVEIQDNGGEKNPISLFIAGMNPSWDSTASADSLFAEAVRFFVDLIHREQEREESRLRGESIIKDALAKSEGKGYITLKQFAPWQEQVVPTDKIFILFLSNRGQWTVQTVPTTVGGREPKQLLPQQEEMTGCIFRHPGGFIASFDSYESARDTCEKITQ